MLDLRTPLFQIYTRNWRAFSKGKVVTVFKDTSTSDIIEISHKEKAWIENEKERKIISYKNYAFDLSI